MGFLKLPEKEQKDFDYEDDDLYPEEEAVIDNLRVRSRKPRPELIMGIVAALAAVVTTAASVLKDMSAVAVAVLVILEKLKTEPSLATREVVMVM